MSPPPTDVETQPLSLLWPDAKPGLLRNREVEETAPHDLAVVTTPPVPGRLSSRLDTWVALALSLVVAAVHAAGAFRFPTLADDEGTYVAQALAVRSGELAHYTYWYDHPPLGWIQLAALDWIPQALFPAAHPVAATRLVIVAATTVSAAMLYALARRLDLARGFAAGGVLLAFLSPLAVTIGRQVYIDNLATPWILGSLVLATNRRRHLWLHVGSGLCFAMAVLTKETSVILLPALIWALIQHSHRSTRAFSVVGVVGGVVLAVLFYPLTAVLRGELIPGDGHVSLWGALTFQLVERAGSGAIWQSASGSNAVLNGWLFYDRWLLLIGLLALPVTLLVRRFRPVGFALLLITLVGMKPGGYLPAMYVIVAIPFLGLAAAAVLDAGWAAAARRGRSERVPLQVALGLVLALVLAVVVPSWLPRLADNAGTQTNEARADAERWVAANLPPDSTVLADNVSWVGLVDRGAVARNGAVWFYKLDTDPAIEQRFPAGWREMDFILSTDQLRQAVAGDAGLVQASTALRNSTPVATFGSGSGVVEVRKVQAGVG